MHRSREGGAHEGGIGVAGVVGDEEQAAGGRDVLAAADLQPPERAKDGPGHGPTDQKEGGGRLAGWLDLITFAAQAEWRGSRRVCT